MKPALILLLALAIVGFFVWLALRTDRDLADKLPPREVWTSGASAFVRASDLSAAHGWDIMSVLGTGSMSSEGYIPAAPPGADPMNTVVAYVLIDRRASRFIDIQPGDLCLYRADWSRYPVLHQAAARQGDGWIMSGNANSHYEHTAQAMTADRFLGLARYVLAIEP